MLRPMQFKSMFQPRHSCMLCILLLFVLLPKLTVAATEVIDLDAWSEFDPRLFGQGVQELSDNTGSGFTSTHTGSVSSLQERPRVFQEFDGLDVSQVGQKVTASFDLQFNSTPPTTDTGFRFGFGDRTTNQGLVALMVDTQAVSGSAFRARYDDSLTDDETVFTEDDYSGFLSASGTFLSGGTSPTGPGGGITDTVSTHTFIVTAERVERNVDTSFPADGIADEVVSGFYTTVTWDSNQPGAEPVFIDVNNGNFSSFDVDTGLGVYDEASFSREPINNIDSLGFLIFLDDPFVETGSQGGYTISNFVLEYDDGRLAADFDEDSDVDADDLLILETNFGLSGTATNSLGDADLDADVDGTDFLIWQNEFTGPLATAVAASQAVPEPSSILLTSLTVVAGTASRFRRR